MKILFTVFACILCLSDLAITQRETTIVALVDKTGVDSPFQVSGRFLLRENINGNELEWSWGQKVALTNISGKPILMFVATLGAIGRYPRGQHAAPGDAPTYVIEDDRFFSESVIGKEESFAIRDTEPGSSKVACCIDSLAKRSDPIAECYLRFVQFADGRPLAIQPKPEKPSRYERQSFAACGN